jgi:serine/threonine protein kinase
MRRRPIESGIVVAGVTIYRAKPFWQLSHTAIPQMHVPLLTCGLIALSLAKVIHSKPCSPEAFANIRRPVKVDSSSANYQHVLRCINNNERKELDQGHIHELYYWGENRQSLEMTDQLAFRYEIKAKLGEGVHGIVWRVKDHLDGHEKAVKGFVNKGDFLHEVAMINKIHQNNEGHPVRYITEVLNEFIYQGRYYAVFPLGQTTLRHLVRTGICNYTFLRDLVGQTLLASKSMHKAGVIHADLHPANIVATQVGSGYQFTFIDFGTAIDISNEHSSPNESHLRFKEDLYQLGDDFIWFYTDGAFNEPLYRTKSIRKQSFTRSELKSVFRGWNALQTLTRSIYAQDYLRMLVSQYCVELPNHRKTQFLHLITHLMEPVVGKRFSVDEALAHPFLRD